MVEVDVHILSLILGTVIPLLVGILTKINASSGVKAVANAFLSALAGVLTTLINAGGVFEWRSVVLTTLLTWVVSVATYYGLYKPTKTAQVVQLKTANFGVGRNSRAA